MKEGLRLASTSTSITITNTIITNIKSSITIRIISINTSLQSL